MPAVGHENNLAPQLHLLLTNCALLFFKNGLAGDEAHSQFIKCRLSCWLKFVRAKQQCHKKNINAASTHVFPAECAATVSSIALLNID